MIAAGNFNVPRSNHRWVIFIAIPLLAIVGVIGIVCLVKDDKISIVQDEAYKISKIRYVIVSGENEKSGSAYEFALESMHGKSWRTFDPCTEEQRALRLSDSVTFEYTDKSLGSTEADKYNPYCYLRIMQ